MATVVGERANDSGPPHLSLSLVIPAYNEARRLDDTLREVETYLQRQPGETEAIVVDDGSTDATAEIARSFVGPGRPIRLLTIPHGGKAAALRAGMEAARLDLIAFSDADLATPLCHLEDLRAALDHGCDIAIGSREGAGSRRIGEPAYRHIMGRVFNVIVRVLLLPGIQDTQCGFKLFRRSAVTAILDAARLYAQPGETIQGPRVTAFDVELLVIARRRGFRICSVPVVWTYGERSKVHPIRDTWQNVLDVLQIRLNAWRGYYG